MLSRVADSIYWMGRYLERAEHTARVLDVHLNLMLDPSPRSAWLLWDRMAAALRSGSPDPDSADPYALARALSFDPRNGDSILSCVSAARDNARQVRELISSEMWEHQNRLYLCVRGFADDDIFSGQPQAFYDAVKEGVQLFMGTTDATLGRGEAYHFLDVGRFLERAAATAALLDAYMGAMPDLSDPAAPGADPLEWIGVLRCCTAFEAYCKVYTAELRPAWIVEFLLLNDEFPHSSRFAVGRVHDALRAIAGRTDPHRGVTLDRLAGRLRAALDYAEIGEILRAGPRPSLEFVQRQCALIHQAVHRAYIAAPIDIAAERSVPST